MGTNDFVKVLKEIVCAWEQGNSEFSDSALEIKMWRKYFLKKELKPYSDAKKDDITDTFMSIDYLTMSHGDPKDILKRLEAEYETK